MNLKQYPKHNGPDRGFTEQDIKIGEQWLYTDVTCPHCGKTQPVAVTGYVGGPCVRCGEKTCSK